MAGTVSATIRINDAFSSALSKLKSGVSGSASAFSKLSNMGNSTGGMFKSVLGGTVIGNGITKGIGMIGNGLHSMYNELDESSRAWQTFNGNMAMLGKSPAQIASTRGDLQKFAQQTIYSASDMASTYSQLAAVGTKSTGKLVKGFGGLAAASSDPQQAMKTLSQQATQAAAKPKIQWADFKLMLEQTPAGMAAVAKTMHKSTGQLVQDVQAGKIKTQDFFDAIAKTGTNANFSKMATQYKTVGQAMDGLRETAANKLQPAFDAVSKVGINSVSKLIDSMGTIDTGKLTQNLVPMAKGVVSGLTSAFKLIGDAMKNIGKMDPSVLKNLALAFVALKAGTSGLALGAIVGSLKLLGTLSPGTLNGIAKALTAVAIALTIFKAVKGISSVIGGIVGAFKGLGDVGKTKVPVPDGSAAGKSAVGFLKLGAALLMIGGAIALAGAGFYMMASASTKLASAGGAAIAVFFGMLVAIAALAAVVAFIGPAMIAGAVGFAIFGAALLLVGLAVFVAAAGMAILATQLPIIATYGTTAAVGILALAGAMAVFGVLAIVAAAGLVLLGVGLSIVGIGFLIAAVGALLFGVAMMIVAVGVTISAVGMMILAVALPLIAVFGMVAAVGMLMLGVALVVVAAVAMIAGMGMMIFALALVLAAPLMMIAAVGALMLGVAMVVLGAGLITVGAGLMVVAAGLSALASGFSALVSAAVAAVAGMVSAVTSGMAGVVSAVSSGISSAVAAARGFAGALVSVGAQLIQGLINGIKSMIGAAVAAVTSVASSVVNAAKSILHIGSPSKLFNQYGQWVVQGLANGLNANNAAQLASASMAQGVVDAASGLNDMALTSPGDMLANGFYRAHAAVDGVVSAMRGIGGSPLAVNGQLNTTPSTVPSDSSFGVSGSTPYTTSTTANATQSTSTSSITVAPGAIQVNSTGNTDMDIESLVQQFEDYLMNVNERRG